MSDGGWCYSNRTVIKESISSCTHTHTLSVRHSDNTHMMEAEKKALFFPPIYSPSRSVHVWACVCLCVCLCVCVWGEQGIKSFLITHLSHEKHSAYFVWALAVWLIQQPSHSDCSLYTKLPLLSVFLSTSSPHRRRCRRHHPPTPFPTISFSSLSRLVLNSSGFSFECTDVCLPDPVATEASFSSGIRALTAHVGCQRFDAG